MQLALSTQHTSPHTHTARITRCLPDRPSSATALAKWDGPMQDVKKNNVAKEARLLKRMFMMLYDGQCESEFAYT